MRQKVFLIDEKIYAELVELGAYASRVRYLYGGTLYDIVVENEDFILDENEFDDEMDCQ